jgi:hypothetical protein
VADIALLILSSAFNMAICIALVRWDRKRLPPAQRERAWNTATFGTAVFWFSPWCILAHFWVTRRSLRGLLLGVAWLVAALFAIVLFNSALIWALGASGD